MRVLRFERRILFAILGVGLVSVFASVMLGRVALEDTYNVGVNQRIRSQLERGLDLYRRHLLLLRENAERTGDVIAANDELLAALRQRDRERTTHVLEALLTRYPSVHSITVLDSAGTDLTLERQPVEAAVRRLRFERSLGGPDGLRSLVVVVTTPASPFEEYRAAGELAETYRRLEENSDYVSSKYLWVYFLFVLVVISVALIIGVGVSRRVTRRVADLVVATKRVGTGDLSVRLGSGADDEIGELTAAFNAMVSDLRESRERIEYLQRIGAWQEFARRLAHEIKNPLTPIQLAVQEMQTSYDGTDPGYAKALAEARGIVEEEVTTLRRLVGEFSRFAKLPEARLSAADLNEFVDELPNLASTVANDLSDADYVSDKAPFRLDLAVERAVEPVPVYIDAMMLKRCADNLLRNAGQAMKEAGRMEGTMWVVVRSDADGAVLEMRDDGPGIPAADRAHVFDPYFTTRASGTGLGLAIVKKVILEHRGEIACSEGPEGGACFAMRLPLRDGTWHPDVPAHG